MVSEQELDEGALEFVAIYGSVVLSHDRSRGMRSSKGWEIEVRGMKNVQPGSLDGLLIQSYVTPEELHEAVGRVMANSLQHAEDGGTFQIELSASQVMGLRGDIARRITAGDFDHGADVPEGLATVVQGVTRRATESRGPGL